MEKDIAADGDTGQNMINEGNKIVEGNNTVPECEA